MRISCVLSLSTEHQTKKEEAQFQPILCIYCNENPLVIHCPSIFIIINNTPTPTAPCGPGPVTWAHHSLSIIKPKISDLVNSINGSVHYTHSHRGCRLMIGPLSTPPAPTHINFSCLQSDSIIFLTTYPTSKTFRTTFVNNCFVTTIIAILTSQCPIIR